MSQSWCQLLCILLLSAVPGGGAQESVGARADAFEVSRRVAAGTAVSISVGAGAVSVRGVESDSVVVSARDGNGLGMPVRVVEATGPRTTLHVAVDPSSTAPSGPVTLDVRVPISSPVTATGTYRLSAEGVASLEVRTGSGSTAARSVRGVVDVESGSGSVEIEGASGDVRARSSNGNITVHDARGRVDVTTGNGNVRIGNVDGDVRVDSINARIDIRCVRGRVDVSDTNGVVELSAVDGDVDAVSSTGKANYRGKIFANRRYRLQTLSGAVRFVVEGVRPGFRGEITTYSGKIEARGATVGGDAGKAAKHRRLAVRFGDGLARIELDSFDGRLGLVALEDETPDPCGSAPSQ